MYVKYRIYVSALELYDALYSPEPAQTQTSADSRGSPLLPRLSLRLRWLRCVFALVLRRRWRRVPWIQFLRYYPDSYSRLLVSSQAAPRESEPDIGMSSAYNRVESPPRGSLHPSTRLGLDSRAFDIITRAHVNAPSFFDWRGLSERRGRDSFEGRLHTCTETYVDGYTAVSTQRRRRAPARRKNLDQKGRKERMEGWRCDGGRGMRAGGRR
ncbi:hypothetical protein B0H16DRAFT_1477450 [Mycena metata]|uniref:Uncharacterized protein n=1 Tax=Mycena metata TaxID=1033252 RepID=A0AAD7H9T5_9AGAR|nr:hypothetical protein B0H16DRAFT_1477450 [Mycena metata]